MGEKTIGVLGGMGPEATLDLFRKIIRNTPAKIDQEHLRVIIDSNAKVPNRTNAILHSGPSPVPLMLLSAEALARAGADFIIIPCVTAHCFLAEVRTQTPLPILSVIDVTAESILQMRPRIAMVGLLATSGTVHVRLFQDRLQPHGVRVLVPDAPDQAAVMAAIDTIKDLSSDRSGAAQTVAAVAAKLVRAGAQGIIAGCTEISAILRPGDLDVPVFDTLLLLARAAISAAGREPSDEAARRTSPTRPTPGSVTPDECAQRLRDWIDASHPETVQVTGDTEAVREILGRILMLAKGKGFLTGLVDLAAVAHSLGAQPAGLGLDSVFQDWVLKGAANSKMIQWLTRQESTRAPALMVIDALEYPGPEHIIDIKNRIRALNNQIDQLRLWILFAHDLSSKSDLVASNLVTGRLHVARPGVV